MFKSIIALISASAVAARSVLDVEGFTFGASPTAE